MAPPVEGNLTECLYDTLGVERNVDPDKLKIAYRKMAMKWHPDKIQQSGAGASADEYQKATERFQMINRAYEVLSDPVERTWYDSHRERILNASSSSNSANAAAGEFDLNLWPYFSPSAFSGFGETGSGFYAVYNEVFKKVHMQEQVFGRMYGNGDVGDAPELGGRDTPYQEVYSFYRYWQGFSSVKDFGWCDKYDVLQAPNRKVRRLMEEENNKVRKRERREFNNSVRQLASFVKKRDKRVIEKQLELQKIQKQKELERKARQLALEKEKQEQIRQYKEQAWTVPSDQEEEWDSDESSDDGGAVKLEKTAEELECMICGKRFKSIKQLHNHERSKKHLENLAALKGAFRNDDEQVERLGKELGIDISTKKKSKQNAADEGAEGLDVSSEEGPSTSQPEVEIAMEPLGMPSTIFDEDIKPSIISDEESVDEGTQDSRRDQQKDTLGKESTSNELDISDAEDGEDDDDENMLASMLKFQRRRQMSAPDVDANVEDADVSNAAKTLSESGPDDDDDDEENEDSLLASMSSLQLNKQKASSATTPEIRQSDGATNDLEETGTSSALEERDLDEEEKTKKGKARRRAKQDRKQAAVSNRYAASATDLEQPEVTATNGDATSDTGGPSTGANESSHVVKERPKLANRGKKIKKEKVRES
jgi:DnaJ family protein A protein 5